MAQARLLAAQGDLSGALDLLEEAERQYVRNPLPDQPIAAIKARLWVRQDQLGAAGAWAREQNLSPDDDLDYLARVRIPDIGARCSSPGTGAAATKERSAMRGGCWIACSKRRKPAAGAGSVIEITMLQALARHAQGDTPAAIIRWNVP